MRRLGRSILLALSLGSLGCAGRQLASEFDYEIEFAGSDAFGDGRLSEALEDDLVTFVESRGSKAAVDDMAWVLERFLKDQGFPFAAVTYDWEQVDEFVRARFDIAEGVRTTIARLSLEGVTQFDPESLVTSFVSGSSVFGKRYFVEAELSSGVTQILRFYRSQGFLDVRADEPIVHFSEDRTEVDVTMRFEEGVGYKIAEARLDLGLEAEPDFERAKLEEVLATYVGQAFAPRAEESLSSRLLEICAEIGRPDAQVRIEAERDAQTGFVSLVAYIEPGPEVVVSEIQIDGLRKTRDDFIRSRLAIKAGDRYSSMAVRESFRQLYKSGLFRKVTIEIEGEGTDRPAVVRVDELPSLEVWAEPGWGSHELARLTTGVRERNAFGTGRALSFEAKAAVRAQKAALTLTDPWFFGTDNTMTYTLFGNRREEQSFTSLEAGVGADLSRRWNRNWSSSLGYQLRFTSLESVDFLSAAAQVFNDDVDIAELITTTSRDSRNDVFIPSGGALSRLSLSWGGGAIGSELDFARVSFTQSNFFPLRADTTLGLSARGGVIAPLGKDDVIPLQERFFNGGENTVRSFREDELGPEDPNGEPIGGEGFAVASLELRQRIWQNLGLAVFCDAGNLVQDHQDWLGFPDLRYAVGIGVRYLLPVGPVRLDWGWNPNPKDTEDPWALHFSVGMSF